MHIVVADPCSRWEPVLNPLYRLIGICTVYVTNSRYCMWLLNIAWTLKGCIGSQEIDLRWVHGSFRCPTIAGISRYSWRGGPFRELCSPIRNTHCKGFRMIRKHDVQLTRSTQ